MSQTGCLKFERTGACAVESILNEDSAGWCLNHLSGFVVVVVFFFVRHSRMTFLTLSTSQQVI